MVGKEDGDGTSTTVAHRRFDPTPPPDVSFVLSIHEGPDAGLEVVVDGHAASRLLVGQSPACDVRLHDREVSRRHMALQLAGSTLRVKDLGSTNGTFVDSVGVGEAFLRGGETLRIGATSFLVTRGPQTGGAPTSRASHFGRVYGVSREMRRLYPLCQKLAGLELPVIIEGETGTGKEMLAESLHEQGARPNGPFVVFDCTAVPPNLVESELFGHERGAFTGAVTARAGVFEQAHGGTILIDEIGDLAMDLQPKLLRAIERSEVRRVGGNKWIQFDARVLAATRRDLDQEVVAGRFRDDLFHRLAVTRIELPPLRERKGDVTYLAQRFARETFGSEDALPGDVLARWDRLDWPGNVRQLRNAVMKYVTLGEFKVAESFTAAESPPPPLPSAPGDSLDSILRQDLPLPLAKQRLIAEFTQRYVARVLEQHGGNVMRAAAASGIARRYFQILKSRMPR
jgi:two-component system response regulator HydG